MFGIPNLELFNEGTKQALQVSNLAVLYSYSTNWANLDDVQLNQSYWSFSLGTSNNELTLVGCHQITLTFKIKHVPINSGRNFLTIG